MPSAIPPASPTAAAGGGNNINGGGSGSGSRRSGIVKLTNCRLVRGDALEWADLWVDSGTGRVVRSQAAFYDGLATPDRELDLGGRIVCPGLVECQLNGAFGFNFSTVLDEPAAYARRLRELNRRLVATGVTSYLPTVTSQRAHLYGKVLPHLAPSGRARAPADGAESLGAHVEGPFLNPGKNGVHNKQVLRAAESMQDLEDMYGVGSINPKAAAIRAAASSLSSISSTPILSADTSPPSPESLTADGPYFSLPSSATTRARLPVKMITVAPEQGRMLSLIPELQRRGIVVAIGHSEATFEEAEAAVAAGATMITHLFNAMRPLHHRNPGIFGVLGRPDDDEEEEEEGADGDDDHVEVEDDDATSDDGIEIWSPGKEMPKRRRSSVRIRSTRDTLLPSPPESLSSSSASLSLQLPSRPLSRPYFGLIADGFHLHPTTVKIAWNAHPDGLVLVTDAMHIVGLPDGTYPWTNGERDGFLAKRNGAAWEEGTDVLAGSSVTLVECVNNFLKWTGATIPQALKAVTRTPAAMLGVGRVKGTLEPGADADLVVFSEECSGGHGRGRAPRLVVDEVWKFGVKVFDSQQAEKWDGGKVIA